MVLNNLFSVIIYCLYPCYTSNAIHQGLSVFTELRMKPRPSLMLEKNSHCITPQRLCCVVICLQFLEKCIALDGFGICSMSGQMRGERDLDYNTCSATSLPSDTGQVCPHSGPQFLHMCNTEWNGIPQLYLQAITVPKVMAALQSAKDAREGDWWLSSWKMGLAALDSWQLTLIS